MGLMGLIEVYKSPAPTHLAATKVRTPLITILIHTHIYIYTNTYTLIHILIHTHIYIYTNTYTLIHIH
jgi:hypothetical protein